MAELTVLAVDLGAESGRIAAVHFDGSRLRLEELHRFPNDPVAVRGTLHWDALRLWGEIAKGIAKGKAFNPASLGVDSWGVDFGLLDSHGSLIGDPVHYRDSRTEGMMARAFARCPREELFARTGIQFMRINTLFQVLSLAEAQSPQLDAAATLLMIPDLIHYWLTGLRASEYTIASTSQMLDARGRTWAVDLLDRLRIPTRLLPEIVLPGTQLGQYEGIPVIAPACHDTASAVVAVPADGPDFAYISSGTWSLVGLEVQAPCLGQDALAANVTNEGGVGGTYRLLRNVMGLWIVQQCRAAWEAEGDAPSYEALVEMAAAAPSRARIDVSDPRFLAPGDHPARIRDLCRESGQLMPETKGAIIRCVLDSLAGEYQKVLDGVSRLTGQSVKVIHVVGGGSRNSLLNQLTADATGIPVLAGPAEATALGNALVQMIALGEVRDLAQARLLVGGMGGLAWFFPQG